MARAFLVPAGTCIVAREARVCACGRGCVGGLACRRTSAAASSRSRCLLAPARFLPSLGRLFGPECYPVAGIEFPRAASRSFRHVGSTDPETSFRLFCRLGPWSVVSTDPRTGFSADSSARSPKGHSARPVESVSPGRRRFEPASEAVLRPIHRADFRGGIATDPSSGPLLFDAVPSGFFPRARSIRRCPERTFPNSVADSAKIGR